MVKKIISLIMIIIILLLTIVLRVPRQVIAIENSDEIRACWISYLDMKTYLKDLNEDEFRLKVNDMYDRIKENQLNTVIVQVRAMSDAIYPSDYFPWSEYISSDRMAPSYDPLEIMVELADEKGLRFEAWINPYRVSLSATTTESFKATSYYNDYREFIMEYTNGSGETCLSYDPCKTETIRLIVSGVKEILNNYDVDGIHLDDYFYVDGMAPDLDREIRKENVNNMVKTLYDTIKSINPECELGISPAGNIDNARAQGADVDRWLSEEGYVDYIMPQIYWTDIFVAESGTVTFFTNKCNEWMEINVLNKPMYLGLALYRVGEESSIDLGWSMNKDNLATQYNSAKSLGFDGYALFRYEWLELDLSGEELSNLKASVSSYYTYPNVSDSYISYTVKGIGNWENAKIDGIRAGNSDREILGIIMNLGNKAMSGSILYRIMYYDGTWSSWYNDGTACGNSKAILNIQIKIEGEISQVYEVHYRCYFTNIGWLPWVKDGDNANSGIINDKLTGIQVKLVKKQ